jgi:hypothetical protein
MTGRISLDDAKGWIETSKLDVQALDMDQLDQLETEILARISSVYDVSGWLDKASTPRLIQTIIAKSYAGWLYDKFYSENQSLPNQYAQLVKANAEMLIQGLLEGTITIPGIPPIGSGSSVFYPNDYSSMMCPTPEDPSLGPARFSMGSSF